MPVEGRARPSEGVDDGGLNARVSPSPECRYQRCDWSFVEVVGATHAVRNADKMGSVECGLWLLRALAVPGSTSYWRHRTRRRWTMTPGGALTVTVPVSKDLV
jgi:hypothetical protein